MVGDLLADPPLAGFFAAGELGPVGGRNFLHSFTASLALFSEQRPAPPGGLPTWLGPESDR